MKDLEHCQILENYMLNYLLRNFTTLRKNTLGHRRSLKTNLKICWNVYWKIYLKENITYQNAWKKTKTVCWGKFTAWNRCFGEEEIYKINNLSFHLGKLKKKEKCKPNVSRKIEIKPIVELGVEKQMCTKAWPARGARVLDSSSADWAPSLVWGQFSPNRPTG